MIEILDWVGKNGEAAFMVGFFAIAMIAIIIGGLVRMVEALANRKVLRTSSHHANDRKAELRP